MPERLLGFVAWAAMRRLARSPLFLAGRLVPPAAAATTLLLYAPLHALGNAAMQSMVQATAWTTLLLVAAGAPLHAVLGTRQLRETRLLELLHGAGVRGPQVVFGVWFGATATACMLAAGGVGALAAGVLFGTAYVGLLADLAALAASVAAAAAALALPAAMRCVRRRTALLVGLAAPTLLVAFPQGFSVALQGFDAGLAAIGLADAARPTPWSRWLGPSLAAFGAANPFAVAGEILALNGASVAPGLGHCVGRCAALAASGLLAATLSYGYEIVPAPKDRARRRTKTLGDREPFAWLVANFPGPDRRWQATGGLAAAGLVALAWRGALPWPELAVVAVSAWTGLAFGRCLQAAFALAGDALAQSLAVGLPLSETALVAAVRGRAHRGAAIALCWAGPAWWWILCGQLPVACSAPCGAIRELGRRALNAGWFDAFVPTGIADFLVVASAVPALFGALALWTALAVRAGAEARTAPEAAGRFALRASWWTLVVLIAAASTRLGASIIAGIGVAFADAAFGRLAAKALAMPFGWAAGGLCAWLFVAWFRQQVENHLALADDGAALRHYPTALGPEHGWWTIAGVRPSMQPRPRSPPAPPLNAAAVRTEPPPNN